MVLENDAGTRRTTTMEERRGFIRMLITVAVVALAVGPARAADDTTGKVTIESISAAAGLGFTWGTGVLEYRGQQYPFMVKGFSVVDVGVSQRVARGEVYNLKSAEDFEGMFMAAMAGATLGAGAGAAAMRNQNGVNVVWTAWNQGLSFSLAQGGLYVKLTEGARALAAKNRTSPGVEGQPAAAPRSTR